MVFMAMKHSGIKAMSICVANYVLQKSCAVCQRPTISFQKYSKGKHDSALFSVEAASKIPAAFGKPIKSTLSASANPILDALATI